MTLNEFWFLIIGVLWAGFLVLEGFDFGVGALLPTLGKGRDASDSDKRRRLMLTTIGPHWDGNEVWLLTAGGATFAAFPHWYATMFSAMYLPLLLVLVALIVRAMGLEYRGKRNDDAWRRNWDLCITVGSIVAPLLIGVALTNLVRGLPIDADMEFAGNFFTLLNPMSLLGGIVVLGLCLTHGALFIALKTDGEIRRDARALATKVGLLTASLAVVLLLWVGFTKGTMWSWITTVLAAVALGFPSSYLFDPVSCRYNLKNIGTALEMWAVDHEGERPASLSQLTPNYLKSLPDCRGVSYAYEAPVVSCQNPLHQQLEGTPPGYPRLDDEGELKTAP